MMKASMHRSAIMPPIDRLAALEATGRELMERWRTLQDSLAVVAHDKQRVRRFLRALWAVALVFGLGFLHRRRRQLAASIRGGRRRTCTPPSLRAHLISLPKRAAAGCFRRSN
jgi:hypothetical protein